MNFIFNAFKILDKFLISLDNNELDNFYRAHFV